jgi:hypothetical protein
MKSLTEKQEVLAAALVLLFVKLMLWPFVEVTDADAVSRILFSLDWAKNPSWISDTIWPPGHFYVLGIGSFISSNKIFFPILIHIIVSWLAFFPVYAWMKNNTNHQKALITALLFSFSPLVLRLGSTPLAESFLLLLLPSALYYITRPNKHSVNVIWAGLMMTLACAFRYEAWLLSALLGTYFLFKKEFKNFFVFGAVCSIFPVIWMISQYYSTGDLLYGFHGNSAWTKDHMGMQFESDPEILGRRIWFFPFSILIATGPIVWLLWIAQKKSRIALEKFFIIVPLVFLAIMIYQAVNGSLMLHHRFSAGLLILLLPLINQVEWKKREFAYSSIILTLCLSLVYPMNGIAPTPRLKNREIVEAVEKCNSMVMPNQGVLIDFMGWDNSYYSLLYSESDNTILVDDSMTKSQTLELVKGELSKNSLLIVLKVGNQLDQVLKEDNTFSFRKSWLSTDRKYFILEIEKK